jgi:hypothetical protein
MNELFPYDINELVGSRVRFLLAPTSAAVATRVDQVINVVGTSGVYAPKTDWFDVGALSVAPTYGVNTTTKERTIQNEATGLLKRVDQITRAIHAEVAEVSPENLLIFEPGSSIEEIAAATGHAAYRHTNIGSADQLDYYRAAFIGMLDEEQGTVREGVAGPFRGRFVGRILPLVQVSAGNNNVTLGEDGWIIPVDLEASPDSTVASAKAEGYWFEEAGGDVVIATS